jgi:protein involved in sex pheromone biosynthesis
MKKVFAILAVASAFAFASCGEKKAEGEAAVDSTAATTEAEVVADSAATAPADSAKVDSAAAPAEKH